MQTAKSSLSLSTGDGPTASPRHSSKIVSKKCPSQVVSTSVVDTGTNFVHREIHPWTPTPFVWRLRCLYLASIWPWDPSCRTCRDADGAPKNTLLYGILLPQYAQRHNGLILTAVEQQNLEQRAAEAVTLQSSVACRRAAHAIAGSRTRSPSGERKLAEAV